MKRYFIKNTLEDTKKGYRAKVKNMLNELDQKQQIVMFAWLCAVRALPFLGVEGDFRFWITEDKIDNRQKHLLSIFHALDIAAYAATAVVVDINDASAASAAASKAADDAFAYAKYATYGIDDDAHPSASFFNSTSIFLENYTSVRAAAFAAANAASAAASKVAKSSITAIKSATDGGSGAAAAAATAAAVIRKRSNFQKITLSDYDLIKLGKTCGFSTDMTVYAIYREAIWQSFHQSLNSIHCQYWSRLYKDLFRKGFVMHEEDIARLKRRLNVPELIFEQGAAAVACYLEGVEESDGER